MQNFDLKNYLTENKLTTNSKEITPSPVNELFGMGATSLKHNQPFTLVTNKGQLSFKFKGAGEAYHPDSGKTVSFRSEKGGRDTIKDGTEVDIQPGIGNVEVSEIRTDDKSVKAISLKGCPDLKGDYYKGDTSKD